MSDPDKVPDGFQVASLALRARPGQDCPSGDRVINRHGWGRSPHDMGLACPVDVLGSGSRRFHRWGG